MKFLRGDGSRTGSAIALALCLASCGGGDDSAPPGPNSSPSFTSSVASASVQENSVTAVAQFVASDPDGDPVTYSLTGTDSAMFRIDGTGNIFFAAPPDYELPDDSDLDNSYSLSVVASDGTVSASAALTVTVSNDKEGISTTLFAQGFGENAFLAGDEETRIWVVTSDGVIDDIDWQTAEIDVIGNVFRSGETGRLIAAANASGYMLAMIDLPSTGVIVRAFNPYNRFSAIVDRVIAESMPIEAGGTIFSGGRGRMRAGLGDPSGDFAQLATSGYGKYFELNFDPFCGASLNSLCIDPQLVGDGLREPVAGGRLGENSWIIDRGAENQDEINYFNDQSGIVDFDWPRFEGTVALVSDPGPTTIAPFLTYYRGSGPREGEGIVGGLLYLENETDLTSRLLFGDVSGKIWAVPSTFMTDGQSHQAEEIEDRTDDFAPETGTLDSPRGMTRTWQGTIFILDADGELFKVDVAPN